AIQRRRQFAGQTQTTRLILSAQFSRRAFNNNFFCLSHNIVLSTQNLLTDLTSTDLYFEHRLSAFLCALCVSALSFAFTLNKQLADRSLFVNTANASSQQTSNTQNLDLPHLLSVFRKRH